MQEELSTNGDPQRSILRIVQIRAAIQRLFDEQRLGVAAYADINRQLEQLLVRQLEQLLVNMPTELPRLTPAEVAAACTGFGIKADLSALRREIRAERLAELEEKRAQAQAAGAAVLEIGAYIPGADPVPLHFFEWQQVISECEKLVTVWLDPTVSRPEAIAAGRRFFGSETRFRLPAGFPELLPDVIQRLRAMRAVAPDDIVGLTEDIRLLRSALEQAHVHFTQQFSAQAVRVEDFFQAGDAAYRLMTDRIGRWAARDFPDVGKVVLGWQGPGQAGFLAAWLQMGPADEATCDQIFARTGIDPHTQATAWRQWVRQHSDEERRGEALFLHTVHTHGLLYDLALVLAAVDILPEGAEDRWWPVVERCLRDAVPAATPAPPRQERPAQTRPASGVLPEAGAEPPEMPEPLVPAMEPEELEAVAYTASPDDRIVEAESAWNVYFKPFLSENWLGLVGVFSLMAAWLFLTMWLWDKGHYYRIAAGAIPMALLTLGAAWTTRFLHRREQDGASPKATALFGVLAFLSYPFNFLLGASLFAQGGTLGVGLGLLLVPLYLGLAFLTGRWIAGPFGFSPALFMATADAMLYLPAVLNALVASQPVLGLNGLLFLHLVILYRYLLATRATEANFRFAWLTYTGHLLLAYGGLCIFFGVIPDLMPLALAVSGSAFLVAELGRARREAIAAAVGLAILAITLTFDHAQWFLWLPVPVALSALLWLRLRRLIEAAWPNEILAIHGLGLAAAVTACLGLPPAAMVFTAIPALAAMHFLERPGELHTLTYSLPLLMIGAVFAASGILGWQGPIASQTLMLAASIYGHARCVQRQHLWLWLLNIVLTVGLSWVILGLFFHWQDHTIPLYLATVSLAWGMLSILLTDAMTRDHRTTVLWGFAGATVATLVGSWLVHGLEGNVPLFAAGVLTLPVLTLAAKRARSALPFYVLLALCGMLYWWLRTTYGVAMKTGLTTALVALLAFGWAGFASTRRIWQEGLAAERFLGKPFVLSGPAFLVTPFEHAAWVLAPYAFGKAVFSFQSFATSPLNAVTIVLCGVLAIGATYRYHRPNLSLLALLCAVTLVTFLCLALAPVWVPIAILAFLTAMGWVAAVLSKQPAPVPELFAIPLTDVHRLLVWGALPASFAGYSLMFFAPAWACGLYGIWGAAFLHHWLVKRHAAACHAVILHGVVLWVAIFFYYEFFPWAFTGAWGAGVYGFSVLSLLLFAIGYALEIAASPLARRYAMACHAWLPSLAATVTLCAGAEALAGQGPRIPDFLVCYAIVHLAARRFPSVLWAIPKSAYALAWGVLGIGHPVLGPLVALLSLTALEVLLRRADRDGRWRLFAVAGHGDASRRGLDLALPILVGAVLLFHLHAYFFGRASGPLYPYALYLLIPYGLYIRYRSPSPFTAFPATGLFAYSNGFLAMEILATVRPHGINAIHAIAASCIVSIACQTAVARFLLQRGSAS